MSIEAAEEEEREALEDYINKYKIEDLVERLTLGLLREKPDTRPKEHWAHLLRLELLREQREIGEPDINDQAVACEVPGRLLIRLFDATKHISSEIVPKETIKIIVNKTLDLLQCDRVSLFVHDKRTDSLVLNASNLDVPIRVKSNQGLAGHVFHSRQVLNIPDCYQDDRFNQDVDKQTGYRTNSMLVMPIVDFEGECMGVVQAINKVTGGDQFSRIDEILLENLAQHVSIALRNAEIYRAAIVTSERANALLRMMQTLSQDLGAQSTILTVQLYARELVQADRCTMFLADEAKQELWSVSTDSGTVIRFPKSAGIAGLCCTEAQIINIPDAYEDSRFNQEFDKKTGYRTTSILAIPVMRRVRNGSQGATIAVIQMINKTEFDGEVGKFDDEDVQVMETFATFVAGKLEGSSLVETQAAPSVSGAAGAFGELSARGLTSKASLPKACIEEGDEEEEEDS